MTDVAIIGGGIVGMTTALALSKITNAKVVLLDDKKSAFTDLQHPITIREQHKKLFKKIGIWSSIKDETVAIKKLNISQKKYFGSVTIDADKYNHEAIAISMPYATLYNALAKQVKDIVQNNIHIDMIESLHQNTCSITLKRSVMQAKRVIIADGAKAILSKKMGWTASTYGPTFFSVLHPITTDKWPAAYAGQRFTSSYSYGLIPHINTKRGWIIITMNQQHFHNWSKLTWQQQQDSIHKDIGFRIGSIDILPQHAQYQTQLHLRQDYTTPGVLGLGSNMLNLPPIAAQGLNITLQNITAFCDLYQRQAWHKAEAIVWQEQYQNIADKRNILAYEHAKKWIDIRENGQTLWNRLTQNVAWTWIGIHGSIEKDIWQQGQGLNPMEGTEC